MQSQSVAYMIGGALLLGSLLLVTLGVSFIQTPEPTPQTNTTTNNFNDFEAPQDVFQAFNPTSTDPEVLTQRSADSSSDEEYNATLQSILTTWSQKVESSDSQEVQQLPSDEPSTQDSLIDTGDIGELFATLLGKNVSSTQTSSSDVSYTDDAIWSGTYNNTTYTTQKTQYTASQAALHQYGNRLATLLKALQLAHSDQLEVLEQFIDERGQTAELQDVSEAYVQLADDIKNIAAPETVASINTDLAHGYHDVGELLWELRLAQDDEELMDRMLTYNESSAEVARGQVALITLFRAYGIVFASHEPGAIFMFVPPKNSAL